MALDNYHDLSTPGNDVNAGFQFEFYCSGCGRKWKSPFQAYRMGQFAGLLSRFAFLFSDTARTASRTSGNFAEIGSRGAKESALADAMAQAEKLYSVCTVCHNGYCADCFDPREQTCHPCLKRQHEEADQAARVAASETTQAPACPNCRTPSSGGRFCAECGFDMASTHKSCPNCGVMLPRQARFCTDCGHGF